MSSAAIEGEQINLREPPFLTKSIIDSPVIKYIEDAIEKGKKLMAAATA
jgi:hypothetical protein